MQSFVVIESDDGLSVIEVDQPGLAELEAERHGGVLVDPTAYSTYEDAFDAMLLIDTDDTRPRL